MSWQLHLLRGWEVCCCVQMFRKRNMNLLTLWKGNCNFDAAVKKKKEGKNVQQEKRRKIKRHTGIDSILK